MYESSGANERVSMNVLNILRHFAKCVTPLFNLCSYFPDTPVDRHSFRPFPHGSPTSQLSQVELVEFIWRTQLDSDISQLEEWRGDTKATRRACTVIKR